MNFTWYDRSLLEIEVSTMDNSITNPSLKAINNGLTMKLSVEKILVANCQ